MISAMLYPYTNVSMQTIRKMVVGLNPDGRREIISTYVGDRQNRRNRPGRALESGYPYEFDMVTNWGTYKDLMRHRMGTQQRQLFSAEIGFDMPKELVAAGFAEKAQAAIQKAEELYKVLRAHDPALAQYAVMHGHFVRWSMGLNDRAAMHMFELRSTPQGHPSYRSAVQEMHKLVEKRSPWRAALMSHVDHNDYYWSRADSEAKQRVKEQELDQKYGK